jgi:DNA polymerase-3 subunit delta
MAKAPAKSGAAFVGDERVVVLTGEENYLKTHFLQQLKTAIAEKSGGDVETLHYDGERATLSDVFDEMRSFGLMQQHKVVIVDDADGFITKHREALERYAEEPVDIGTLVLRPSKWNKTWRLHKAAEKVGKVVECEPLGPAEAERFIVKHVQDKFGVKMTPSAAGLLIESVGTDLCRLESEAGKLAASIGEGAAIDTPQVEKLVGRASEEDAWAIQEAMLSGDAGRSIAKVNELVELARQPKELVFYFVGDLVRKLHHAAVMVSQKVNDFVICKELRIWGDRQKPFMNAARKLGVSRAATLLAKLVELDSRSKSGLGDAGSALERFCVQFAEAMKGKPI